MTLLQSIILGIVQGLTEFLPISSSGHLVIVPYLFKWQINPQAAFIFDVLVQLGTLLAVIIYFRDDLVKIIIAVIESIMRKKPFADPMSRLGWMLVLATIPAIIAGLLFKDQVESAFSSPIAVAFLLLGTAALLVFAEIIGKRERQLESLSWLDALIIGFFQVVSLLPGVSRSGSTISGGMFRNIDRASAARFSFLMSVPVMIGAGGLAVLDLFKLSDSSAQIPSLVIGFITAAIVGYFAIRWLISYLAKRPLYIFAIYCIALSILVIFVGILRA